MWRCVIVWILQPRHVLWILHGFTLWALCSNGQLRSMRKRWFGYSHGAFLRPISSWLHGWLTMIVMTASTCTMVCVKVWVARLYCDATIKGDNRQDEISIAVWLRCKLNLNSPINKLRVRCHIRMCITVWRWDEHSEGPPLILTFLCSAIAFLLISSADHDMGFSSCVSKPKTLSRHSSTRHMLCNCSWKQDHECAACTGSGC